MRKEYVSFFEEFKFDLLQEFEDISIGVVDKIVDSKLVEKDDEVIATTQITAEEIFVCCASIIKSGSKFSYIKELYEIVSLSEKERQIYFIEKFIKANPDYLDNFYSKINGATKYSKTSFVFKSDNFVITVNK
jgi:hypothetical protein